MVIYTQGASTEKNAYFANTSRLAFFFAGRWFNADVFKMCGGKPEGCSMKLVETTALHFITNDGDLYGVSASYFVKTGQRE